MSDLYSKCPLLCDGALPSCLVCSGNGFVRAGINEKQVEMLRDGYDRAQHIDRYFEGHKEEFDKFIDWLRKNPYPDKVRF